LVSVFSKISSLAAYRNFLTRRARRERFLPKT
jgi:hypothetical protein